MCIALSGSSSSGSWIAGITALFLLSGLASIRVFLMLASYNSLVSRCLKGQLPPLCDALQPSVVLATFVVIVPDAETIMLELCHGAGVGPELSYVPALAGRVPTIAM